MTTGETAPQQPGSIPPHLSERDRFNLALVMQDRENTNRFAAELIQGAFRIIGEYLARDMVSKAEFDKETETYVARVGDNPTREEAKDAPSVTQYIVPDFLRYPTTANEFQQSLAILLEAPNADDMSNLRRVILGREARELSSPRHKEVVQGKGERSDARLKAFEDSEVVYRSGDRLRLFIPVPDSYVYPEPLDEADVPPRAEPEIVVEYIPAGLTKNSVLFLIRPDSLTQQTVDDTESGQQFGREESLNYEVVRYVSGFDVGKQHIEGEELTARLVYKGLTRRMPGAGQVMRHLVELAAEFNVVPQQMVSANGSINL